MSPSYDGPDRRETVSWRDLNEAVNGLRQELHTGLNEVREDMTEGFARNDRRIVASSVAVISLLSIAITVAIAIIK